MADPVSPEPQGNSISAAPGAQQTAPDPLAQAPTVQTPPGGFNPTTFSSAGDAVKQYNLGVLQATAAGGMMQQKAFQESHQAIVDARTQAMGQAATRAGAVGGGDALTQAMQARMGGGMDLRTANAAAHQADFTAASKQRDMNFSNYMKEVSAAIPLAQAHAQGVFQQKAAATKQASVQSQYEDLAGLASQNMAADKAANDAAVTQAAPKLKGVNDQLEAMTQQYQDLYNQYNALQKGAKGFNIVPGDKARVAKAEQQAQQISDQMNQMHLKATQLRSQRDQINADIDTKTPAPKQLSDYISALSTGGSLGLQGKVALGAPAVVSGEQRMGKALATSDVTNIMSKTGLKLDDAKAVLNHPDYQKAIDAAEAGLKVGVDNRGRIQGTTNTPWDTLTTYLQGTDPHVREAILNMYQKQYQQTGRSTQRTAKQATARQ